MKTFTALFFLSACQIVLVNSYAISRSLIPALAGCGKPLPHGQAPGKVTNVSIASGGIKNRSYLVSIPPKYNSFLPTPLIISYHGGDRNASQQLDLDQLTNPEFNTRGSIVIYPQGIVV